MGILEADDLDGDFGGGLDVENLDDALEEGHVGGAGDDDELVGALIGHNLHLAADHAAVGVGDEGIADGGIRHGLGGLRAGDAGEGAGGAGAHTTAQGVGGTRGGGGALGVFVLLAAGGDELLEGGLDVGGLGVLDGIDVDLLKDGEGLVDKLQDFDHAVDVFLGVGDEEGVGALEILDLTVRTLEALDNLLGLLGGDVLGREDLADNLSLLGVTTAFGDVQEGLDALLADGLEGHNENEALAHGDKADAVELKLLFDGLEIFLVGPLILIGGAEGHGDLRNVGRGEQGAVGDLRIDLQEEFGGGVVELQFGAATLAALGLGELLGDLGG